MKWFWTLPHHGERLSSRKGEFHGPWRKEIRLHLTSDLLATRFLMVLHGSCISCHYQLVTCIREMSELTNAQVASATNTNLSHTQSGGDSLASLHTIIWRTTWKQANVRLHISPPQMFLLEPLFRSAFKWIDLTGEKHQRSRRLQ